MKTLRLISPLLFAWSVIYRVNSPGAWAQDGENPADHLPPHITRVTWFGERADWSHNRRRILFLSKTFGDAIEIELETKIIRNLTAHYPHHGYTRALYLANGDVLLSGPASFDPAKAGEARVQCFLYVRSVRKRSERRGTRRCVRPVRFHDHLAVHNHPMAGKST
jgi:hypothetical protein